MKGRSLIITAPPEDILWGCYTKLIHCIVPKQRCWLQNKYALYTVTKYNLLLPTFNIDFSSSHMSMRISLF